jgi:ribose 5-phosphate isomerase A
MTSIETFKKLAAEKAVEQVKSGMVLGLGTGSSAKYATMKIGQLYQAGELTDIVGIPTSSDTVALAQPYGLPLATLDDYPAVDLAIDGADEIDPHLDLIKGLGAALLREKMIESVTKKLIIVADSSKVVKKLGARAPLPVEVVQFCWRAQVRWLAGLGCIPVLRGSEANPVITDNGNYLLDCTFPHGIDNPAELNTILLHHPGIVEHGLFLGLAHEAIVAGEDGLQFFTAQR